MKPIPWHQHEINGKKFGSPHPIDAFHKKESTRDHHNNCVEEKYKQ